LASRFVKAETMQRLATLNVRNHRELAKRVFAGFIIATEVKDRRDGRERVVRPVQADVVQNPPQQ
jgi:hypothetical protein